MDGRRNDTGRSVKFVAVGQYHIHVVKKVTKRYRLVSEVHSIRPVPHSRGMFGRRSGTSRSAKFIHFGRYHIHVKWMVAEVVPADR